MEADEEHVLTLLSMGFMESEVRKALRIGKNDLNEAVGILTNDHPTSGYDTLTELADVEMKDDQNAVTHMPVYGPHLPPSYDEVVDTEVI